MSNTRYTKKERHAYIVGYGAGIWGISLPDVISTLFYEECTDKEKISVFTGYSHALAEIAQASFERSEENG